MTPSRVKLTICGSDYILSTTESEEYMRRLGERLQKDIHEIMSGHPGVSVTRGAVVAALGYLDEIEKNSGSVDNMRSQLKDYLDDAAKARLAARQAQQEAEALRSENKELSQKLQQALQKSGQAGAGAL